MQMSWVVGANRVVWPHTLQLLSQHPDKVAFGKEIIPVFDAHNENYGS